MTRKFKWNGTNYETRNSAANAAIMACEADLGRELSAGECRDLMIDQGIAFNFQDAFEIVSAVQT